MDAALGPSEVRPSNSLPHILPQPAFKRRASRWCPERGGAVQPSGSGASGNLNPSAAPFQPSGAGHPLSPPQPQAHGSAAPTDMDRLINEWRTVARHDGRLLPCPAASLLCLSPPAHSHSREAPSHSPKGHWLKTCSHQSSACKGAAPAGDGRVFVMQCRRGVGQLRSTDRRRPTP